VYLFFIDTKNRGRYSSAGLNEANSTIESRKNKTTKTEEALQETQRRVINTYSKSSGMAYRCKLDSQYQWNM
jgi:hypothetical protein